MKNTEMTDAELMKDTREKLSLTQKEMAPKVGYQVQQRISAIEVGKIGMSGPARTALNLIRKYEL